MGDEIVESGKKEERFWRVGDVFIYTWVLAPALEARAIPDSAT